MFCKFLEAMALAFNVSQPPVTALLQVFDFLNASGFLWGQGPGKGGTGGDRLVPWRNYLLEIDIDTLLVLVGSSGNTEIRSIAFRHTLHLYLYMYIYIYIYTIYILWNEIIQNLQMYKYLYIVSLDIYFQSIYLSIYLSI